MKILCYTFNGYSLFSQARSAQIWWITNWIIEKDGKEIYKSHEFNCLPTEVLRVWAKTTKLHPNNKFNSKIGSHEYDYQGVTYVSSNNTFVPLSEHPKLIPIVKTDLSKDKVDEMLIMRNSWHGLIWQAYRVQNELEKYILTKNANSNGFIVCVEPADYTVETSPGWRDTKEWKNCLDIYAKEEA